MEFGFYERAKFLVERYGLSIIPAKWGEKTPVPEAWQRFCDQLPKANQLFAWSKGHNDKLNISIALGKASRLIALDVDVVDPYVHQELIPFRDKLVIRYGSTGRYAYLYRYNGEENRSIAGLQLLSHGRQLVIEGLHPSGNQYKLCVHEDMDIGEALASAPFMPQGTFEAIEEYIKNNVTELSELSHKNKFSENLGRNDHLISMAYSFACNMLVDKNSVRDIAKTLLNSEWGDWFRDPTELSHKGRDPEGAALKMAQRMVDKATKNNDIYDPSFFPNFDKIEAEPAGMKEIMHDEQFLEHIVKTLDHRSEEYKEKMKVLNEQKRVEMNRLFVPPPIPESGLLRDIYEYGKHFYTEVPVISLAAGFGVMSQLTNMNFCTDQVNGTCMILSLAPSGVGKSFAHTLLGNLFRNDPNKVTAKSVSSQALYMRLCESRDLRYVIDEVDSLISSASIKKNNTSHGSDVANAFNILWCNSWEDSQPFETDDSIAARKRAQDKAKDNPSLSSKVPEVIHFPMVSLFGSTTIENFESVADRKVVMGGFLNRFLVFQQKYYNEIKLTEKDDLIRHEKYQKIKEKVENLKKFKAQENPYDLIQKWVPINLKLWDFQECRDMVAACDVKYVSSDEARGGFSHRYFQHVLKISLLYAVSEIEDLELTDVQGSAVKYRYATNYKVEKHHVEYAIKLYHWMLDEIKELYEKVAENDSSASMNTGHQEKNANEEVKLFNKVIKYLSKQTDFVTVANVVKWNAIYKGDKVKEALFFERLLEYNSLIEFETKEIKKKKTTMIRIRRK